MRYLFYYCLILISFLSCKKESNSKVDIYLLTSFQTHYDRTTNPALLYISNAVLADTPFVSDNDIEFYEETTATFKLKKNIRPIVKNYGSGTAFVVTVNKQPIYFGTFHPAYLSSITYGVATIDPFRLNDSEVPIQFATLYGDAQLQQLDKRNDRKIIKALKATGRLR